MWGCDSLRVRVVCAVGAALVLIVAAVPASAQVDISGGWQSQTNEDMPHRVPGAELGDYTGLPINAAARQKANHWEASTLSAIERQAQPHAPQYFMRGPVPDLRVQKLTDPVTQELIAYTIEGTFGRAERVIWMDGRPRPSELAEHTWSGFSTGKIEGNTLTITTTHMKYGVIQRNGVPSSPYAVMTEHFIRHGDFLTDVIIVDDPVYLEEPLIRTSQWVRSSNVAPDPMSFAFEVVDEVAGRPRGDVPQYPLGTVQSAFAEKYGVPLEAAMGGKKTTYPEYELELKKALAGREPSPSPPKTEGKR